MTERLTLLPGNCLEILPMLEADSIDSCVTDPPYHLTSIVKRFGKQGSAPAQFGSDGAFARASRGFMGKEWDGGEIAFQPETWALIYRVLKPGAHLLAFGAPKNFGFMQVAIHNAGFEIRDVVAWLFGSGFPKSHDVSKGIDKARGETGRDLEFCEFMRSSKIGRGEATRILQQAELISANGTMAGHFFAKSQAGQPAVATRAIFEALRPHLGIDVPERIEEIIDRAEAEREVTGQKTSGIANKDEGARHTIGASSAVVVDITAPATPAAREWEGWGTALKPAFEPIVLARKPLSEPTVAANVLRWRTGALNIDGCRVGTTDAGERGGGRRPPVNEGYQRPGGSMFEKKSDWAMPVAGRWPANVVHDGSDEVVGAFPVTGGGGTPRKATPTEGSAWAIGAERSSVPGGATYCDQGSAARFFYSAKASKADRNGSKHPTVKPLDLMQYLVRLVTPKGGLVLDPFAGTGTTGEAAFREGMRAILIEREEEYQADIRRRMALCMAGPDERRRETIKARQEGKTIDLGPLFAEAAE